MRSALRPMYSGGSSGKKMHPGDDAVGFKNEIASRRRRQHGGIIGET
jgi:hypothetical protein